MEIISIYHLTRDWGKKQIVLCKVLGTYIVIASFESAYTSAYSAYADTFTFDNLDEATLKYEELQD